MARAVYILGPAGVGKSTFTEKVMRGYEFGPLEDLHAKRNARYLVTLRGHRVESQYVSGLYLGAHRDEFPGTDGLDRASSATGVDWLMSAELPEVIVAEGATLATRPFLATLSIATELQVYSLTCDPVVHDLRLAGRGSGQAGTFVQSTVTKSLNLVQELTKQGVEVKHVDTADESSWFQALTEARNFLSGKQPLSESP